MIGKSKKDNTNRDQLRRRAISPSPTANVFSYHAARSQSVSNLGRLRGDVETTVSLERRLPSRGRSRRLLVGLFGVCLLIVVGMALRLDTKPKVVLIGNAADLAVYKVEVPKYQHAAQRFLAASVLNRNKITIDSNRVSAQLLTKFPELEAAAFALPLFGGQPVLYIQPAAPVLILRAENSGAYVVDESGYARLPANQLGNDSNLALPTVVDQSGLVVGIGAAVLPRPQVAFIQAVAQEFAAQSTTITSITLPPRPYELNVRISGKPYYIKFNMQDSSTTTQQLGGYFATKAYLEAHHITPRQYVDARLPGRAYYK